MRPISFFITQLIYLLSRVLSLSTESEAVLVPFTIFGRYVPLLVGPFKDIERILIHGLRHDGHLEKDEEDQSEDEDDEAQK